MVLFKHQTQFLELWPKISTFVSSDTFCLNFWEGPWVSFEEKAFVLQKFTFLFIKNKCFKLTQHHNILNHSLFPISLVIWTLLWNLSTFKSLLTYTILTFVYSSALAKKYKSNWNCVRTAYLYFSLMQITITNPKSELKHVYEQNLVWELVFKHVHILHLLMPLDTCSLFSFS